MEKQNVAGVMPATHFLSIRQLTVAGFLSAITILGLTGWFHPLVIMNATILHIPTIIS